MNIPSIEYQSSGYVLYQPIDRLGQHYFLEKGTRVLSLKEMNILWVKRTSHGSVKHEITQLLVFTIFYANAHTF